MGGVATLVTRWAFEVENRAKLNLEPLRPYLSLEEIEKAGRAFVRAGGRTLSGARIFRTRGHDDERLTAYEPRDIGELRSFAQEVCATDLVPQNYRRKPADAMVAMMYGKETAGVGPLTSLQYVAVINGRPAFYSDAVPGIAFNKGLIIDMEEFFEGKPYEDDFKAVCIVTRPGGRKVKQEFSVADAKLAGLWGKAGPWKQYPKRMMQWRTKGWAIRDAAPHALFGPTYEELRDVEEHIGPEKAKEVNQRPTQPLADPELIPLYDAWGAEYLCQPGEVAQWIRNAVDGSTAEELETLVANNPDRFDVRTAVEIAQEPPPPSRAHATTAAEAPKPAATTAAGHAERPVLPPEGGAARLASSRGAREALGSHAEAQGSYD